MRFALFFLAILFFESCKKPTESVSSIQPDTLTVLSFNILYGGDEVDFNKTVELIRYVNPDVVGIQEAEGNIEALARALHWKYYDSRLHVLSKYPILTNDSTGWYFGLIEIRPNQIFAFANIHLPSDPYGPELVRDGFNREEVLKNEDTLRYHELDEHLRIFDSLKRIKVPIILTGDFNSPSHRDWSDNSFLNRPHMKYKMAWPVSVRMERAGFLDTYRNANPDVLAKPGLTWTPGYPDRPLADNETHDRIDFIWTMGIDSVVQSSLAGEKNGRDVSISVDPYPSDHRAVISKLVVTPIDATLIRKGCHYVDHPVSDSPRHNPQLVLDKVIIPSGEPIKIEWRDTYGNRFDWIAIYPEDMQTTSDYYKSEVKTNYLVYGYTRGKVSGKLQLNQYSKGEGWPLKPGKYKVHLLLDDGYTSLAETRIEITKANPNP